MVEGQDVMTERRNFAEILDEYLGALRAGNAPDREALLARHPDLAEELRAALLGVDFVHGAAPRLAPDEDADALPGRSLGDYRLLRELGRGGMAVVYEAEQVSLARRVALKVLPFAAVLDPKQLQRFKNEAMAAAQLHHTNIVPVYGVGCERGVHYYAMQYVEGQSLATAIRDMKGGRGSTREGPKTPISSHGSNREPAYIRMAAALGVQAAQALDHAHQLGIVHRDVKPGNLLADLAGTLWVTDFGLASSTKDASLTITGELLGTIRYMSPEQALAKRVPVDHRTDVYSLGATLYELFTLEPAFPGDDPHRVIQDIALEEPVPPRRLNPGLPRDLETVVIKAMSKDPSGRYATAQAMADDLTRFLENRPVEAKRPGLLRRASKWSRRHRTLVGAMVVLLLLSIVGLATGTALLWREQAQTQRALDSAQANLDLALQALDQIYIEEAEGHPRIREGLPKDLLQKGLEFYEKFVEENAVNPNVVFLMGNASWRAGLIFRELGEEERAVESLGGAISAYDRAIEIDPLNAFVAHANRGIVLRDLGRFDEALAACDRAIEIDPRQAPVHHNRARVLKDLGRLEEALAACDRAIEIDSRDAQAHVTRGSVLLDLRRLDEAVAACDRAIEIDSRDAVAHNNRGQALLDLGLLEEALAAYDRAIEIDSRYAVVHDNRGIALHGLGRFEEGLAAHDRAIEIDPRVELAHTNRAVALIALERFEEALEACDRAIEIDPPSAEIHLNRGSALGQLGRVEEALEACDRALEIDPRVAEAHVNRAGALYELGRFEEALDAYGEAIALDPDFAEAHCFLGFALMNLGRFHEALSCFRRGHELGSRRAGWPYPSGKWLEDAEQNAELEGRLEQVLSGEAQPRDGVERIEFAALLYSKANHEDSAQMYAEAFADDAALAEDLARNHRYNAACSAALAAIPGGTDAAEWRGQALEWLRAELAAREKAAIDLAATFERWKQDPDLASVRDRIGDLPETERAAWRGLWAAVEVALAAAQPAAK
jgi:tetratricopeptide (TPR) repeat protein